MPNPHSDLSRPRLVEPALRVYAAKLLMLVLGCATLVGTSLAQNVTVSPNTQSYPTLKAAFDAINAGTHTGSVAINVVADTTETATSVLNASGSGSANYTSVSITPTGSRVIRGVAGSGSGTVLINFNGADNVVLDGLGSGGNSLLIDHTATAAAGTISFSQGASNNIIRNATILGSAATGAVISFLGDTVSVNGNDSNVVTGNIISDSAAGLPQYGIRCVSSPSTAARANQFNELTNNQISDAFSATANSALIALNDGCNEWRIEGNRLFQSAPRTFSAVATFRGIEIDGTNGTHGNQAHMVRNNTIGYADAIGTGVMAFAGSSGKVAGILFNGRAGGLISEISGNEISAISLNTSASGNGNGTVFMGIHVRAGRLRINGNRVGATTANRVLDVRTDTTTAADAIGINCITADPIDIFDNTVAGMAFENTAASTATGFNLIGIALNGSSVATSVHTASGNRVGGSLADSMQVLGTGGLLSVRGIVAVSGDHSITGNVIENLTGSDGTATGVNASVVGISVSTNTSLTTITRNRILKLRNSHPTADTKVRGIYMLALGGSLIADNEVSRLDAASSAAPQITGILNETQAGITRNNMVSLGADVSGNVISAPRRFMGIQETSFNTRALHNSVLIFGDNVSGNVMTVAFESSQLSGTRTFQGNSFSNQRSNGSGTGRHLAIRVGSPTGSFGFISNWNNLHVSGAGGVLGEVISLTNATTLTQWQAVTAQDANSLSIAPAYLSTENLHLAAGSPLVDAAPMLADVEADFDGDLRSGSLFDLGADELNGTTANAHDVSISEVIEPGLRAHKLTGVSFQPSAQVRNIGLSKESAVPVRFRIRDAANVVVYDQVLTLTTLVTGAMTTVDFPSISLAAAGVYSWTVSTELVGDQNPGNDATNSTLTIGAALSGTYTVGSGGDFDSLTNDGGAFHALNGRAANSAVELQIISDLNGETGKRRLQAQGASSSILIRPTGAARTVRGSALGGLIVLEGARNVTIDGSTVLATSADVIGGDASIRQLTIINEANSFGAVIQAARGSAGSDNFVVRNVIAQGRSATTTAYGIAVGSSVVGSGAQNDNARIENCSVRRAGMGILVYGSVTPVSSNPQVLRNDLSSTGAEALGESGIFANNVSGALISGNRIGGMANTSATSVFGIGLASEGLNTSGNASNSTVTRNVISGLSNLSLGQGLAGIAVGAGTNNLITNNMISDLMASSNVGEPLSGLVIHATGSSTASVLHNSVHLSGDRGAAPASMVNSYGLRVTGNAPNLVLKNNIISNTQTADPVNVRALAFGYAGNMLGNLQADNNLYWSSGPDAGLGVVINFGAPITDMANWRQVSQGEANSLFADPLFISNGDLHIQASPLASPAISAAQDLAQVSVDIDGDARAATERDIGADEVATPPQATLSVSPSALNFGTVSTGSTAESSVTLRNTHPSQTLQINSISAATAPFELRSTGTCANSRPLLLTAGQSCTLVYRFAPTGAGSNQQTITAAHNGTGDQQWLLNGTGALSPGQLSVSAGPLDFGSISVSLTSAVQAIQIANSGGQAITVQSITGPAAPFIRNGGDCGTPPFQLAGQSSCLLGISFAPTQFGAAVGSVSINAGAAGSASVNLLGTGLDGQLQLAPTDLDFGTVNVGSASAGENLTLSNLGNQILMVSNLNGLAAPFERVLGGTCNAGLPIFVDAGSSCTLVIRFAPLLGGVQNATLTPSHDGAGLASVNLVGNGLMPDSVFRDSFEGTSAKRLSETELLARIAMLDLGSMASDVAVPVHQWSEANNRQATYWLRRTESVIGQTEWQIGLTAELPDGRWQQWPWQPMLEHH